MAQNADKKRDKKTLEDYGSYAVDLSKLIFGSFVLGTTIRGSLSQWLVLAIGFITTGFLGLFGIWLKAKSRKVEE